MKRLILSLILVLSLVSCSKKQQYINLIYSYSRVHKVDPLIIYSMIEAESNFKAYKIGGVGEIGLGQIRYKYHKKRCDLKSEEELKIPRKNIRCVVITYKHYEKLTPNSYETVAMYNAGPEGYRRGLGRIHAKKVNKIYKKYKGVNLWQTT